MSKSEILESKNADGTQFRICTKCIPNHIENCCSCFGFGLRKYPKHDEEVPIIGAEVGTDKLPPWKQCPECLSTPDGVAAEMYEHDYKYSRE